MERKPEEGHLSTDVEEYKPSASRDFLPLSYQHTGSSRVSLVSAYSPNADVYETFGAFGVRSLS